MAVSRHARFGWSSKYPPSQAHHPDGTDREYGGSEVLFITLASSGKRTLDREQAERHGNCENERGRTGEVSRCRISPDLPRWRHLHRKRRRGFVSAPSALQRPNASSGRDGLGTDADGAG